MVTNNHLYPSPDPTAPMTHLAAVTPHDTNDLAFLSRGVYVGVTGNLAVLDAAGNAVTITSLAAGVWHPLRLSRIKSTGTTATSILIGE
jgi:hypothetical protein